MNRKVGSYPARRSDAGQVVKATRLHRLKPVRPSGTDFSLCCQPAALIGAFLLFAGLAQADFVPDKWPLRRPLQPTPGAGVSVAVVDQTVYAGSRERLLDLRLVRNGGEVPYVLERLAPAQETKEFQPKVLNQEVVPGAGVQAMLDLGSHPRHNQLRIASNATNFQQKIRIETSDDAKRWATVLQDAFVFDFTQDNRHASLLSAEYPVSTRRYVRLTVLGWTDPLRLTGAWVSYQSEKSGVRDVLATATPRVTDSAWVADLGAPGIAHDALDIEIGPGLFYRSVDVETSADASNWYPCGTGILARTADLERLSIHFPEQWDRYLRLRVHNGDNPPLAPGKISFSAWRRVLKFRTENPGEWFLYYGNAEAKTVSYDLSWSANLEGAQPAKFGEQQRNPSYREPAPPEKPWSERHMSLLYGVLILAVLAMGTVSVRFLLKVRDAGGKV